MSNTRNGGNDIIIGNGSSGAVVRTVHGEGSEVSVQEECLGMCNKRFGSG